MNFKFEGDIGRLKKGIDILRSHLNFDISDNGLKVVVEQHENNIISVSKRDDVAHIKYRDRIHFFRALGLLMENMGSSDNFEVTEEIQFETNCAMFDVSQSNAVIKLDNIKFFLRNMAIMGMNMFMIYTEDSYDVKEWKYFGYMRGRYSQEELMEIDRYGSALGIEVVPCMQTLAHLGETLRWGCFNGMRDDEDTLLVGEPKVYEFIEDMIVAASKPFKTKRIHIGMDEAWRLGQGEYLIKNGYASKFDIMISHLNKVLEITDKYGLKPMIWSDMFFRAVSESNDYYDIDSKITSEMYSKYPNQAQLVYWDYYHSDEAFYREWIKRHRLFGTEPIFAGCIWSWTSYAVNYGKTFKASNAALNSCKKEGIKEVMCTVWGGDVVECNIYANLLGMQLFAEHGYSKELDMKKLAKRFKFVTGMDMECFMNIKYLDEVPGTTNDNFDNFNASHILMWQDILCGLFDKDLEDLNLSEHYKNLTDKYAEYEKKAGSYAFLFEFIKKISAVLEIKSEIGLKITEAYKSSNRNGLNDIAVQVLPELRKRVVELKDYHRKLWFEINKPFGWDIYDLRYGGLIARIDTTVYRIREYLEGKVDKIGELEEEKQYYNGGPLLREIFMYDKVASANRISRNVAEMSAPWKE